MYTQTEIRSNSNSAHIYAPKCVEVKVLSTTLDGVCTVEYKGDKFSCAASKLGSTPPKNDIIITEDSISLF